MDDRTFTHKGKYEAEFRLRISVTEEEFELLKQASAKLKKNHWLGFDGYFHWCYRGLSVEPEVLLNDRLSDAKRIMDGSYFNDE